MNSAKLLSGVGGHFYVLLSKKVSETTTTISFKKLPAWPHGQSVCMKSTNKDLVNNERYRMGDEMFDT